MLSTFSPSFLDYCKNLPTGPPPSSLEPFHHLPRSSQDILSEGGKVTALLPSEHPGSLHPLHTQTLWFPSYSHWISSPGAFPLQYVPAIMASEQVKHVASSGPLGWLIAWDAPLRHLCNSPPSPFRFSSMKVH